MVKYLILIGVCVMIKIQVDQKPVEVPEVDLSDIHKALAKIDAYLDRSPKEPETVLMLKEELDKIAKAQVEMFKEIEAATCEDVFDYNDRGFHDR